MKQLIILLSSFALFATIYAQENNEKLAMLLSVDGDVEFKREGKSSKLKVPQYFIDNDQIMINDGKVIILYGNGTEKEISEGKFRFLKTDFTVPLFNHNASFLSIGNESHYMQSQSYSAFTLRGEEEEMSLFPLSSKLIDQENSFIVWNIKSDDEISLHFQLFKQNNDSLVWKSEKITENKISLGLIPLKEGELYYWTCIVPETDFEQIGMINVLDQAKKKELKQFKLEDKIDYLSAYIYYKENECWFDAWNTMVKATVDYPEIDLFQYILSTM